MSRKKSSAIAGLVSFVAYFFLAELFLKSGLDASIAAAVFGFVLGGVFAFLLNLQTATRKIIWLLIVAGVAIGILALIYKAMGEVPVAK